jgi:hypothetical protein
MKSKLFALTAVVITLAALFVGLSNGQEKKSADKEKASIWMKKKLEFSQNVLAGLTEADFQKIDTNAKAMSFLGHLEKWTRADRPDYKEQMFYFEVANKDLLREAREKNLDGATLAYYHLTASCVNCHKIVRDVKK